MVARVRRRIALPILAYVTVSSPLRRDIAVVYSSFTRPLTSACPFFLYHKMIGA